MASSEAPLNSNFPIVCLAITIVAEGLVQYLRNTTFRWVVGGALRRVRLAAVQTPTFVTLALAAVLPGFVNSLLSPDQATSICESWFWISVASETIMAAMLPPLIFEAAFNMSTRAVVSHLLVIVLFTVLNFTATLVAHGVFSVCAFGEEHYSMMSWEATALAGAPLGATDPIAVATLFETIHVRQATRVFIEAESLFNDGVSATLFDVVHAASSASGPPELETVVIGLVTSVGLGYLVARFVIVLVRRCFGVDTRRQQQFAVLVAVYVAYRGPLFVHGSGVLCCAVFGLVLSDHRERFGKRAAKQVQKLFEFVGYWGNAVIFAYTGYFLGQTLRSAKMRHVWLSVMTMGLAAQGVLFVGRLLGVAMVGVAVRASWAAAHRLGWCSRVARRATLPSADACSLVWGGIRGGLSLLLIKAVTPKVAENMMVNLELVQCFVAATVFFSLLVSGSSFGWACEQFGAVVPKSRVQQRAFAELIQHLRVSCAAAPDDPPEVDAEVNKLLDSLLAKSDAAAAEAGAFGELQVRHELYERLLVETRKMEHSGDVSLTAARYMSNLLRYCMDDAAPSERLLHRLVDDWRPGWPSRVLFALSARLMRLLEGRPQYVLHARTCWDLFHMLMTVAHCVIAFLPELGYEVPLESALSMLFSIYFLCVHLVHMSESGGLADAEFWLHFILFQTHAFGCQMAALDAQVEAGHAVHSWMACLALVLSSGGYCWRHGTPLWWLRWLLVENLNRAHYHQRLLCSALLSVNEAVAAVRDPVGLEDEWRDVYEHEWHSYKHCCGHYVQVVWAQTYKLGCGAAQCRDIWGVRGRGHRNILVCHYSPQGNVVKVNGGGWNALPAFRWQDAKAGRGPCSECPSSARKCFNGKLCY